MNSVMLSAILGFFVGLLVAAFIFEDNGDLND